MSLIDLCLNAPQALYAINNAVIETICAENTLIPLQIMHKLRAYNLVMRQCERMPSAMAVLIFFWLASLHSGVRKMVAESVVGTRLESRHAKLFAFTEALIIRIGSMDITEQTAPGRAICFYYMLRLGLLEEYEPLMYALPGSIREKVTKGEKAEMIERWRKRLAQEEGSTASAVVLSERFPR